jgi:hypothetical protein
VIQIGNSDEKLTQAEWSEYIAAVNQNLQNWQPTIHFLGYSPPDAPWQNACWVFEVQDEELWIEQLKVELAYIARQFRQDSIALTLGYTEFVKSDG